MTLLDQIRARGLIVERKLRQTLGAPVEARTTSFKRSGVRTDVRVLRRSVVLFEWSEHTGYAICRLDGVMFRDGVVRSGDSFDKLLDWLINKESIGNQEGAAESNHPGLDPVLPAVGGSGGLGDPPQE